MTDSPTSPPWLDPITVPPNVDMKLDNPLTEHVVGALRTVYDPEIPVNLFELGLIYLIDITPDNNLFVKMSLTSPGCPVAGEMPGMVQSAIFNHVPEIKDVDVEIVWDPPWRPDMMAETARLELGMF